MKQILILSSIVLTLLLSSCTSSFNSFADYDKNVDLNTYKTYAWLAPGDSLDANPQTHQFELMYSKAITYASDENLKKKGMILNSQNPDCLFKFSMGFEQKTTYSQSPTVSVGVAVGGPYYYGGVAVPVAGGNITEHQAEEAFLYVQMFDTRTGALLWTGGARKMVDNAADSEKNIKLALNAIFSKLKIRHK